MQSDIDSEDRIIAHCVLDSALIGNFANSDKDIGMKKLFTLKFKNSGKEEYDDTRCFWNYLLAIRKGKCKFAKNDKLYHEYNKVLKKTPKFFAEYFMELRANNEYVIDLKEIKKDVDLKDEVLKDTSLESKKHFIDAARKLNNSEIVSTYYEINTVYLPSLELLSECDVFYKRVCDAKNQVWGIKGP